MLFVFCNPNLSLAQSPELTFSISFSETVEKNKLDGRVLLFISKNNQTEPRRQENYDLQYILRRDWESIGPKLAGKIHIYCGDMDNYYLNNAVYLMEEFLESKCLDNFNL